MNIHSRLYLKANHILFSILNALIHFCGIQCQRVPHLHACTGIVLEVLDLIPLGFKFLRGIESNICLAISQKLIDIFLIDSTSFTLTVWSMFTTEAYAFVEIDT